MSVEKVQPIAAQTEPGFIVDGDSSLRGNDYSYELGGRAVNLHVNQCRGAERLDDFDSTARVRGFRSRQLDIVWPDPDGNRLAIPQLEL